METNRVEITAANVRPIFRAIRDMERACLASDCEPTTIANILENGLEETRKYYQWLRVQAPITAIGCPHFDSFFASEV